MGRVVDKWESAEPYHGFMGRWSGLVAQPFVDWLGPALGQRWLDVGCGSGALSEVVIREQNPARLVAIDASQDFVDSAKGRLGILAECRVGDAMALSLDADEVDLAVSGLVLNFVPEPGQVIAEMKRVTAPGGTVGVYVWDYAGQMDFLRTFWDVVVELDPSAAELHEGQRFPDCHADALHRLFVSAGLHDVDTASIDIETLFEDFEDYWRPFLGGQGPAGAYVRAMGDPERAALRTTLEKRLPWSADGSIAMQARAWAVKGRA